MSGALPSRTRMPEIRSGVTRKFSIAFTNKEGEKKTLKFYVIANVDEEGKLREIFIRGDKMGGLSGGALDAVATLISIGLQYGVPLDVITCKLRNNRFGPSGFTGDPEFPSCSSMFDLLAQWLNKKFGASDDGGDGGNR